MDRPLISSKMSKTQKLTGLYSPRTTYRQIIDSDSKLLADITLNFDRFTIGLIKNDFMKFTGKMGLIDFISIVKTHLSAWQTDLPSREFRLVRCLTTLFHEIDTNGNDVLEWEEFTNYIVEKATLLKNLKVKSQQIKGYTRSAVRPKTKIEGIIPKAVYIPDINKLAFFQEGTNVVMFMDPDNGEFSHKHLNIKAKQLVVNMSVVKKGKQGKVEIKRKDLVVPTQIRILDLLYVGDQKYKLLFTATSDGVVRGWKYTANGFVLATQPDNQEEFLEHQFTQEIYCLAWDSLNEVLFCAQKDGVILVWNLKTDTQKLLQDPEKCEPGVDESHTMMVMDMVTVPKLHFMASGGMDGKVILWDVINNKVKWVYKAHTRGVLSVSYNEQLILLFSAGFDHQICIWNPYISTLIHKIQAHSSPIMSVKVIEGTYQVVSLDSEGIVKITDIRRFNLISTFTIQSADDNHKFAPTNLALVNKPLKLCFVGRSVSIFEYDKNYNPNFADDFPTIACLYHPEHLSFYTPCGNKIKVWSALTGDLSKLFLNVVDSEITAFEFDSLQKRFLVGDLKGNVIICNAFNGAKLKPLPNHSAEVIFLTSYNVDGSEIFISAGADNQIHVVKETSTAHELLRCLSIGKEAAISAIMFHKPKRLLMVGTSTGAIGFYDSQTGKLLGTYNEKTTDQITSIVLLDQTSLITTNSAGMISLVTAHFKQCLFEKVLSISHPDPEYLLSQDDFTAEIPASVARLAIVKSVYSEKLHRLYVVDDKMYLTCYDFQKLHLDSKNPLQSFKGVSSVGSRRNAQKADTFANIKVDILWSVKVHNEIVKNLHCVEDEQLLVTTSHDKKVKFWNSKSGELLDSLQQNYDKREPRPLGYKKLATGDIYNTNLDAKIGKLSSSHQAEFDPYYGIEGLYQPNLRNQSSNPQWGLQVNFKNNYERQKEYFEKIRSQLEQKQRRERAFTAESAPKKSATNIKKSANGKNRQQGFNTVHMSSVNTLEIQQKLSEKKLIMKQLKQKKKDQMFADQNSSSVYQDVCYSKDIGNSKLLPQKSVTQHHHASYLTNQSVHVPEQLRSLLANQSVGQRSFTRAGKNKHNWEYSSILSKLKSKEQVCKDYQVHKKYIDNLYKTDIQSTALARSASQNQITLTKTQYNAVVKLSNALQDIDKTDKRPLQMLQNVTYQGKLPRIE